MSFVWFLKATHPSVAEIGRKGDEVGVRRRRSIIEAVEVSEAIVVVKHKCHPQYIHVVSTNDRLPLSRPLILFFRLYRISCYATGGNHPWDFGRSSSRPFPLPFHPPDHQYFQFSVVPGVDKAYR
jgi:hypothetical protein